MAEEQTHEEEHTEDLPLTEEESEGVSGGAHKAGKHESDGFHYTSKAEVWTNPESGR